MLPAPGVERCRTSRTARDVAAPLLIQPHVLVNGEQRPARPTQHRQLGSALPRPRLNCAERVRRPQLLLQVELVALVAGVEATAAVELKGDDVARG